MAIAVPFLTFRRYYLDRILSATSFYGKVLDVGGKKENKRGRFRPPKQNVESWEYLNIDISTEPDYCCPADNIPVTNGSFHMVLMTEVLEHLENPQTVLKECHRVLRKHGQLIISIPFLYMIHSDPHDYLRWTPEGIRKELINVGFEVKQVLPMGSLFAVIYDLLRNSLHMELKNRVTFIKRLINKLLMPVLARLFLFLDRKSEHMNKWVTTGYYVVGIKT